MITFSLFFTNGSASEKADQFQFSTTKGGKLLLTWLHNLSIMNVAQERQLTQTAIFIQHFINNAIFMSIFCYFRWGSDEIYGDNSPFNIKKYPPFKQDKVAYKVFENILANHQGK